MLVLMSCTESLTTYYLKCRCRMNVSDLKHKIRTAVQSGSTPFMVTATAGTTVVGAFDSIKEIRKVCDENGIWLHVDVNF